MSARMHPTRERFESLDGLRGVAAIMVVLLHAPLSGFLSQVPLFRNAFLFVDFFFVLSGFVIAHAYEGRLRSRKELSAFVASRWRRVYPLHLFMLMLFLAFALVMTSARGPDGLFEGANSPSAFVANLFLVHAFGTVDGLGWNYPSWSISAEFGAYLAFGAGSLWLGRRLPIALVATLALSLVALAAWVGHLETTTEFGWLRCLYGFACGAWLRIAVWPRQSRPREGEAFAFWTLAEGATLMAIAVFVSSAGSSPLSLAAPFVFAFAVFVFAHQAGHLSHLLAGRVFAWLGLVSYSIYMTHAFVISRTINVATVAEGRLGWSLLVNSANGDKAFTAAASPLALVVILCGTLAASALTYRFVEKPGQRWHRPRSTKPEGVAEPG